MIVRLYRLLGEKPAILQNALGSLKFAYFFVHPLILSKKQDTMRSMRSQCK